MPNNSLEALQAEITDFLLEKWLILVGLMSTASPEVEALYQRKFEELKTRALAGTEEMNKLPKDQQFQWGAAYYERVTEELLALIRDMRAKMMD